MQMRELIKEGVSTQLLDLWRRDHGETLLPVQQRAVRLGLLNRSEDGRERSNLIITAPTSSGKTFCAEMAALAALMRRRQVIWLFPLKSLAEQVYRDLGARYAPLGISLLLVTGDHPENDRAFREGRFQMALAIYEKCDLLFTAELDRLAATGLVIVDELQMLFQPGRGPVLERLLTKIIAGRYRPRLLGLSAVLDDTAATAIADWLHAERLDERVRPIDLYRGVAAEGAFTYRSFNSGLDGSEPFRAPMAGEDQADVFLDHIAGQEGTTLVFVKSRQETVALAFRLAARVNWPPAKQALAAMQGEEKSFLTRSLIQALGHGVGFHNADLTSVQRNIVEQAFGNKEIRVLVSTTTLAMGVNLPADTVYLETVKYVAGEYDGRPSLVPISRAEFENMAGRAGRLGHSCNPVGRAVVLADSAFDREVLWDTYIAPSPAAAACPHLPARSTADWLLNLIVSGLIPTVEEIPRVLTLSLAARMQPGRELHETEALAALVDSHLVEYSGDGRTLTATAVGRAVALAGLTVDTGRYYRTLLEHGGYPETPFGWTALALSSNEWENPPGLLSRLELRDQAPLRLLYQRFDHALEEAACLLPENHRREPLTFAQAARVKALMVLDEWARLVPAQRLEERFQIHLGQIQHLGEQAAYLVGALAGLLAALDRTAPAVTLLQKHCFSLRTGLPATFERLHRQLGRWLRRSDFATLRQAGVESVTECAELPAEQLRELLGGNANVMEIIEKCKSLKEEDDMKNTMSSHTPTARQRSGSPALPGMAAEPELVEIDGSQDRERYVIKINGLPVKLTGKSFKYFTKLAWSRRNAESGWLYKEDIETGFNQARYLYRMKNEITASLAADWSVVENNRLGYYRLDLDPERIQFNFENLMSHPDWEIRSLFERSEGGGRRDGAGLTH
jgi:helicase